MLVESWHWIVKIQSNIYSFRRPDESRCPLSSRDAEAQWIHGSWWHVIWQILFDASGSLAFIDIEFSAVSRKLGLHGCFSDFNVVNPINPPWLMLSTGHIRMPFVVMTWQLGDGGFPTLAFAFWDLQSSPVVPGSTRWQNCSPLLTRWRGDSTAKKSNCRIKGPYCWVIKHSWEMPHEWKFKWENHLCIHGFSSKPCLITWWY